MVPTKACLFQQATTYMCGTLQLGETLNKVHYTLSFPKSPHGAPWLELCDIKKFKSLYNRKTQQKLGLHSRHSKHIYCTLGPTRACLPKQATYQSSAKKIKCTVHCLFQQNHSRSSMAETFQYPTSQNFTQQIQ